MNNDLLDATGPRYARALSHPTRHRLLLELGTGATISQLAHRLEINKGSVSHHLAVLVDAGLVRRDRTRTVRGGTEQYYVKTAQKIEFGGDALPGMLANLNRELAADPDALLNHRILHLTRRQAEHLSRHLDQVVHGLEPAGEREPTFGVVVSVYRRSR